MLLCVAACGRTDDGAMLTFAPPTNLGVVAKIDVVLASAEPGMIDKVGQRTSPRLFSDEPVTYYRQAASGGSIDGGVDGAGLFTIQIAPNIAEFPADQYIPFVLLYGTDDSLVGIATLHSDTDPTPLSITVVPGALHEYTLDLQSVASADRAKMIARGQDLLVDCVSSAGTWRSGLVWRPAAGPELRLLFPDLGANRAATDALSRLLDLDCDLHAAQSAGETADCDDTLPRTHPGADETCDGQDTNCDGQPLWTTSCTGGPGNQLCPNAPMPTGVAMCDDTTGTIGTCQSDPECLCAGSGTSVCTKCVFAAVPTGQPGLALPCTPAVGTLALSACTGCTVVVLGATTDWEIAITNESSTPFGQTASNVSGHLLVKAKYTGSNGGEITSTPGQTVGQFQLAITNNLGTPRLLSVALEQGLDNSTQCPVLANGIDAMICRP